MGRVRPGAAGEGASGPAAEAVAAVADRLERSAAAHIAAAEAHDDAVRRATSDLHSLALKHCAEAHRAAAKSDLLQARHYRDLGDTEG